MVITLLKEEVEDSTIAKYTTTNPKGMKRTDLPPEAKKKTSGFSTGTTFTGNAQVLEPPTLLSIVSLNWQLPH